MAEIKAFRALRFDTAVAGKIDELVCPPYDIISEEQRQAYLNENENNIIRLELPRGENPYADAQATLKKWIDTGVLKQDEKDSIYIYEEEFTAYGVKNKFKGCITRVKLEEFSKGIVLPHEETLSKAKKDRFELMKATNCNFSQIYSLYMDEKHTIRNTLDRLSAGKPEIELTDNDGVTHRLWIVTDEAEISAICKEFDDKKLYIADGHHRYETALNYRNYCHENKIGDGGEDYVMMMLVDMEHEGLVVFPTHRIVRDLESFDAEKAEKLCEEYFYVEKKLSYETIEKDLRTLYDMGKKAYGFYSGGNGYTLLTFKDSDVLEKLLPDMFLHFAHSLPTRKRPYCNHFPMLLYILCFLDMHNKLLPLQSQLQRLFLLLYTMLWFLIFYSLKFPPYLQNLCFPIVLISGLDQIHLFVAVLGLK